jgi:hypothetical protein
LRAHGMPNAWVKRLMQTLVSNMVNSPVLKTDAPSGVEVVMNDQAQGVIVHLINYHCGNVERLSWPGHSLTLRHVNLQVDLTRLNTAEIQRVYMLPNTDLEYHMTGGWLVIHVPSIEQHAVLVIPKG